MHRRALRITSSLAFAGALVTGVAATSAQAQTGSVDVVLLRSNTLTRINTSAPGTATATLPVTGLTGGDTLVGIDFRPANNQLYGLASSGRLYTINPSTGEATTGPTLSTAPTGVNFAVDFNPVADRLRVVSNTGQSLRINVTDGATTVDGSVAYGAADAGNGTTAAVVGAAYTNPDNDPATATELLVIESARDVLALQAPPNDGVLATRGPLGRDATGTTGFDIGGDGRALAVIGSDLVSVNTSNGTTTMLGSVPGGAVDGMAIVINAAPAPAPTTTTTAGGTTSTTVGLARTGAGNSETMLGGIAALLLATGALLRRTSRSAT